MDRIPGVLIELVLLVFIVFVMWSMVSVVIEYEVVPEILVEWVND